MFIHESDEPITYDELRNFINLHSKEVRRYKELEAQYDSEPAITKQPAKEKYKPDHRLVANFGKYIIDTFNGYFSGIPIKVSHEDATVDEAINHFWRMNDMDDNFSEISKLTSLYGRAYMYVWQDEQSETRTTYVNPKKAFVIYADDINRTPKYGVYYSHGTKDNQLRGVLVTDTEKINFSNNFDDSEPHYYPTIPLIEFVENDERQSLIAPVESIINAYNQALSDKVNDISYFADAYLKILGADIDESDTDTIRDNRIINISGDVEMSKIIVEFLDKPDGGETQEAFLDRAERLIYQISMVANINDESFNNDSGVALEFKMQPMRNMAASKERKFTKSLNRLFSCFTALPTNIPANHYDSWVDINYRFTRNMPRNIQDEAETARNLEGVVSKETQLSTLSIIDDVKAEIERMDEEKQEPQYDFELGDADDELPRD